MDDFKPVLGKITKIESLSPYFLKGDEKIEDLYGSLCGRPDSFLLLSGGEGDCARYSFLVTDPFLRITAWGRRIQIGNRNGTFEMIGNPFDVIGDILNCLSIPPFHESLPFYAGAVGYLGYDLRYHLEKLPDLAKPNVAIPDLYLIFPSIILIHDQLEDNYHLVALEHQLSGEKEEVSERIHRFGRQLQRAISLPRLPAESQAAFSSNFTRDSFMAAVERAREYIRQGDIYQVNLSQLFTFQSGIHPYALFRALFACNPAPFYAYLNCGGFSILCTSPERFILRSGDYMETRPIKGTRPRGKGAAEDERLEKELLESSKEDAELSMIVDLLRNDLGKVCVPGSIYVQEHKRVETYQNVFHLVSVISGRLKGHGSQVEILRALFPGGSITGCPKIRAMEIIEELEPVKRGIYTGAIGYIGLHDVMNLNIAIRTAVYKDGQVYLSVGGGIVYNSDPECEFLETLHKGETFFSLLNRLDPAS